MNALLNLIDQDTDYAAPTSAASEAASSNAATNDMARRKPSWQQQREVINLDSRRSKPAWERDALATICRYAELPNGWDSYAGKPLRLDTGMFALQVLSSVMSESTPIPSLIPVASGGVQIEWHRNGLDIELYIAAPLEGELSVYDHLDAQAGVKVLPLKADLSALREHVGRLVDFNRHIGPKAHAG
jgi:hypothetical protein